VAWFCTWRANGVVLAAGELVDGDPRIVSILVAVDFSPEAGVVIEQATGIARRLGARILLAHAAAERDAEAALRDRLEQERVSLAGRGVDATAELLPGPPAVALVEAARARDVDLIVMGSRGLTGFRRFLLGSVAERVLRSTRCAVLIARPGAISYRQVLVATDFSPGADRALAAARLLAAPDAHIDLLHCWQVPYLATGSRQSMEEASRRIRDDFEAQFADRRVSWPPGGPVLGCENLCKPAAHGIQWWIEEHPQDLVVVGRHGQRGLRQILLGSVAEMTARYSPCSVAIVPS
jgi:nucleotide-binding universal stress UspA family protein